jgi:hypothetical protein
MASLTAHLRRPDDHGRLGFHPACPICRRERLAGEPPSDAVVSPRSQALLAASVLALSSATPTAVLAAEPDQEQEGATAPEQVVTDDDRSAPELETGGQPTELRLDAGPAPDEEAAPDQMDEAAPVEQEPVADDDVPADDVGDGTGAQSVGEQEEPPASDPLPPPPPAETVVPSAPTPTSPVNEVPAVTHDEPQADGTQPPRAHQRVAETGTASPPRAPNTALGSQPRSPAIVPTQTNGATAAFQPEPIEAPSHVSDSTTIRLAQSSSVSAARRDAARRGDRFHVVQRGESLWSIAKDLLGDDASVSRIAREVNRLWELNSARIGTGEPDLLLTGTRIALR